MDDNPAAWRRALEVPAFARQFNLEGDSLKRPPRGFAADHPLIEDLKRKDFIAIKAIESEAIHSARFGQSVLKDFRSADALCVTFARRSISITDASGVTACLSRLFLYDVPKCI